jgi:O-antigen/teichoic acid export membrane protein
MSDVWSRTDVWMKARCLMIQDTLRLVFMEADTVTIRVLLATSSLFAATALLVDPGKFKQPAYSVVAQFGSVYMWALYFFLHFIGTYWRIFERSKSRPTWALAINTFGFAIWFVATASISWAVGSVGIVTSMGFTLCLASAWSLYRTGLGRDVVSL